MTNFLGQKYRTVIAEKVGSSPTLFSRKMSPGKIDQSAPCKVVYPFSTWGLYSREKRCKNQFMYFTDIIVLLDQLKSLYDALYRPPEYNMKTTWKQRFVLY